MKEFKIWATIELVDDEEDIYEDQGAPAELGIFDTLEEAEAEMERLLQATDSAADRLHDLISDMIESGRLPREHEDYQALVDALVDLNREV
jgi:GTP1/Obg family GTP-binding protein